MGDGQFARWFITIQNPTFSDGVSVEGMLSKPLFRKSDFEGCVYMAHSPLERASTGTLHLHCVLMFDNSHRKTKGGLRKLLKSYSKNGGFDFSVLAGTKEQVEDYFLKRGDKWQEKSYQQAFGGDSFIEGVWIDKGQGVRTDVSKVKALIDLGMSDAELWEGNFDYMLRHYRAVKEYKKVKSGVRSWKTELWLYLGVPGTGKSYAARSGAESFYIKPSDGKWWDMYEGQSVVILDEFEKHQHYLKYHDLLSLADDSPLLVEVKNGFTQFLAKKLIITANSTPADWFRDRLVGKKNKKGKVLSSPLGISAFVSRLTGVRVYWQDNGRIEGVRQSFISSRGGVEVKSVYQEYAGVSGVERFIKEMNEGLSAHSFACDGLYADLVAGDDWRLP